MQEAQEHLVERDAPLGNGTAWQHPLLESLFQPKHWLFAPGTHSLCVSHIQLVDVPILSPCHNVGA